MAGNKTRAARNIAWIERYCRVPEGAHVGKPVVLRAWQRRELVKIYDNPAGTRTATFGRKNGKTALSACLLLLHLCGPRRGLIRSSAAQSRDQAATLFNLAVKVVRLAGEVSDVVVIRTRPSICTARSWRALQGAVGRGIYSLWPVTGVHRA